MKFKEYAKDNIMQGYAFVVEHPDGWDELAKELHDKIIVLDPDYVITQTKEKFGALRYYIGTSKRGDTWTEIYKLIAEYETMSTTICQDCGAQDDTVECRTNDGGFWVRTLCAKCRPKYDIQ